MTSRPPLPPYPAAPAFPQSTVPAYHQSELGPYAAPAYSQSTIGSFKEQQRPPSPTPSELEDADESPFNFRNLFNRGKNNRPNMWVIVGGIILLVVFILIMVFHTKIVDAINPYAEKLRNLPGGWAIPIALLVIFSFPPLIGGEFIDILVGVVWGVWKGFLIASAGHLLGEIANWFVFKYWCTGRSEKYEAHKLGYACLARVVREGGFWAVLIIRYSAIPNHLTTVMFSVVGIKFWVYLLANILSLPNLFLTVYLGVIADEKNESKGSKILSYVVTGVAIIVTIAAGRWTFHRMDAVRPGIVEERKIARAARRAGLEKRMGAGAQSQRNRAYPGGNNSPDDSPTSAPLLLPRTSDN